VAGTNDTKQSQAGTDVLLPPGEFSSHHLHLVELLSPNPYRPIHSTHFTVQEQCPSQQHRLTLLLSALEVVGRQSLAFPVLRLAHLAVLHRVVLGAAKHVRDRASQASVKDNILGSHGIPTMVHPLHPIACLNPHQSAQSLFHRTLTGTSRISRAFDNSSTSAIYPQNL
jgi:hypothetical protein